MQGGLRIRLRAGGGLRFDQIAIDHLVFCISAPDDVAFRLHEIVGAHAMGSLVRDGATRDPTPADGWSPRDSVRTTGFAAEEALLPESLRAFSGHRLLQEVSAMPRRLLFFDVCDLAARLSRVRHEEVELVLPFQRGDPSLEALVDVGSLSLFCTPAVNLFSRRLDRIQVGSGQWEYHVIPDRTRPMDFEVHSIETVTGFGTGRVMQQRFLPLYETGLATSSPSTGGAATTTSVSEIAPAYYTVRREPRLLSQKQKQDGARSAYVGEEVYMAIVDQQHAPYREDLRQLSVAALVTNRDLPTLLPRGVSGAAGAWRLDSPGPVKRVDAIHGPTRPVTRRPVGELGWSLVNHLALNHRSLVGETAQDAAATLRRTLELYAPPDDRGWSKQIDGVRSLTTASTVRRLPFAGPLTFGTGVSITVELDDLAFQGSSAYGLASVLERFFARHAGINSFTQTTLVTPQRGEVTRWPPRLGARPTL